MLFDAIKENVSILEVISNDLGLELKSVGSENFGIADEREHGGCPMPNCGHFDCFRIRFIEGEPNKSMFKCFSCGEGGDVISWRAKRKNISLKDAAMELAREYNVPFKNDWSPIQEILNLASDYYVTCMWEVCNKPLVELGRMTPVQYQMDIRRHSEKVIRDWKVGWSDGGLYEYLSSMGFDDELILESGLVSRDKKDNRYYDFLPPRCFIYPHFVKGEVSHFTFKDPGKKLTFQLPKKYDRNGYMVYGQDTVELSNTVFIVEGENDLLSCWDTGKVPSIVATIGQISSGQLDWIKDKLKDKNVITLFDPDDAGDKYRVKIEKLRRFIKKLAHVRPPDGKDIDEHLAMGADLESLIINNVVTVDATEDPTKSGVIIPASQRVELSEEAREFQETLAQAGLSEVKAPLPAASSSNESEGGKEEEYYSLDGNPIIQRGCRYYRTFWKDGEVQEVCISDFIIKLHDIFLTSDGERLREVIVIRDDGYTSPPIMVSSADKVTLKSLRVLLARAADATFIGRESDVPLMWKLIFDQKGETLVQLPDQVGRVDELRGWIFRNKFISDSGKVIDPDKNGIFWMDGHKSGVRARSLDTSSFSLEDMADVPYIDPSFTVEERDEFMGKIIKHLSDNRCNPGQALTLLGWAYSCVHSNTIFELNRGFPFLFLWGTHGKGKTTIARWLQDFFDMRETGYTSIPQMINSVGLGRKASYYSSMPMLIDEVRSNRETEEYLGLFRSYYDRTSRVKGVKDKFGVNIERVRSTFIFVGEDQFDDQATKERCIPIRVSPISGNPDSYKWLEDNKGLFTGITFHWILEGAYLNKGELINDIVALDRELVAMGCPQRTSKNWAAIGVFAMKLGAKYLPDFDYKSYLFGETKKESSRQKQDTTLMQFFEYIEAIQAQENTKITSRHITYDNRDDSVHIWFPAVYKIVQDEARGRFPFSKTAVMSAIKEEPYYKSDDRKVPMGMEGTRRLVLTLSLEKAPDCIKNIAMMNV